MGNATSYQRHYLYWGAILLLLIPPSSCWNIPYFGGGSTSQQPPSTIEPSTNDNVGVLDVDVSNTPMPSTALDGINNIPLISTVASPIIGPVDAPHLRYIPSYFSNQIPTKVKELIPKFLSKFHNIRLQIYHLLWYKPPVGIVGAYSLLRVCEKVYGVFSPPPPSSGEEALQDAEGRRLRSMGGSNIKSLIIPGSSSGKGSLSPWGSIGQLYTANIQSQQIKKRKRKRRSKTRKGRSFDLDGGDRSYSNFGGIETVRVRACQEGLRSALSIPFKVESSTPPLEDSTVANNNRRGQSLFGVKYTRNDRSVVTTDDQSETTEDYQKDTEIALTALQLSCPPKGSREYFVEQSADALSALSKYTSPTYYDITTRKRSKSKDQQSVPSIDEQNIQLLLHYSSKLIELRVLDSLLRTLRDRHLIVSTRLKRTRDYWKWHVNLTGGWLGRLSQSIRQQVMTVFPELRRGEGFRDRNQREYELATATWERELEMLGKAEKLLLARPTEIDVSDLLTVTGDNNRRPSLWSSLSSSRDDPSLNTSKPSMSQTIRLLLQSKNRIWLKQTEQWTRQAREAIQFSLDETISSSFTPISNQDTDIAYSESRFLKRWAAYDESTSDVLSWLNILTLVDYAASPRRAGERRHFQISSITSQIKRYDVLGIPSSALLLFGANSLHDKVIAPHKQEIVDFIKSIFTAVWGIFEFRFYTPMKDIVLDLLNRRPRMVDPFALLNEQTSLDNMLMDLGVGDGTAASRSAALAAASRMYESEVSGGAIRGILRGRVAQLMLIQIQQLKADLLQAMDQIDNLVDANRLNVQLVASIPAVLILVYGTRALYLFWTSVRMKDFKLPHDIHSEMSDYLKKIEECLVLSNYHLDGDIPPEGSSEVPIARTEAFLRPKEMGKLLLLVHSYLNLLDYMSPPFPKKTCDSIHQSIQNLLMQGQMSTARQLELLKVIQSKHDDLLKSL